MWASVFKQANGYYCCLLSELLQQCSGGRDGPEAGANAGHQPLVGLGRIDGVDRVGESRLALNQMQPTRFEVRASCLHPEIAATADGEDIVERQRAVVDGEDGAGRIGKCRVVIGAKFGT